MRLSEFNAISENEPIEKPTMRLSSVLEPTNVDNAILQENDSVNIQKNRGLWEDTKYFLGEGIAKPIVRAVQRSPAMAESLWQMGVDNIRNEFKKDLVKNRAVFGISDEEFEARTPEVQAKIDRANFAVTHLNRAEDVSIRLQDNWNKLAAEGFAKADPALFQGDFMQNPSWIRAVVTGMESVPLLGLAAAVSVASKSPTAGASLIGVVQGAEERGQAKKAGVGVDQANAIFLANAVVNSALESVPLTSFMKGGQIPLKAFSGVIGRKAGTALTVAAQEGGEEALQTLWTNAVAQIGYDPTRELTEGLVESIIAGSISGGVIGSFSPAKLDRVKQIADEAVSKGVDVEKMTDVVSQMVVQNGDAITEKFLDDVAVKDVDPLNLKNIILEAKEDALAGTFKDPNEPRMLEYLSKYIPSSVVVRLDKSERLRLANSPRKDLIAYSNIYKGEFSELQDKGETNVESEQTSVPVRVGEEVKGQEKEVTERVELSKKLNAGDTLTQKMSYDLVNTAKSELAKGNKVILLADNGNKEVEIVSADGGKLKDAQGQNWGTLDLFAGGSKLMVEPKATVKPIETVVEPVIDGKVAKASSDINTKLAEQGFAELTPEEQARFTPIKKQEQLDRASELLANDYERAKRMANGQEPIPSDINDQVLFNAVKNKAKADRDGETLRALASSPLAKARSVAAQTLGASGFDNGMKEADPVKIIEGLTRQKEKVVEKKLKGKKTETVKADIKKSLEKAIAKEKVTKQSWSKFLEELQC